jgi:dTDP-L-rhamnose 4-epimerase
MQKIVLGDVLVTGGAGFIGTAIGKELSHLANNWIVLDNLHEQVHGKNPAMLAQSGETKLVRGDVTSPDAWDSLLENFRPDTVIHLAAETGTAQSLQLGSRHASVNVLGTTQMLDAFRRFSHTPKSFILAGSRAVYGEGQWVGANGAFSPGQRSHAQLSSGQWDFKNSTPKKSSASYTCPKPTSIYGATKLAQEQILSAWVQSHDSSLITLRFQNVYGPGQSLINSYTGIVSLFSQIAIKKESIPLYEDGRITRDFVYIDDVVASVKAAVAFSQPGLLHSFDIGSGVGTTISELARVISAFHGAPEPHITGDFRDGDVRHAECDIQESVNSLQWEPKWTLRDGISSLQDWIADQI